MARLLAALAVMVLGVILSGCRGELVTSVDLERDGSGVVSLTLLLDREAAAALRRIGPLDALVGAADLRADGWQVVGPVPRPPGGFVEYRADRAVRSPEEATAALARVSPVFAGLRVGRSTGFATVRSAVQGEVDLSGGAEAVAGDPLLTRTFGSPLGAPVAEVERELGGPLGQRLAMTLEIRLPGRAPQRVELPLGQRTTVAVATTERDVRSLVAGAIGLVGLGVTVTVALAMVAASRRSARFRPPTVSGRP